MKIERVYFCPKCSAVFDEAKSERNIAYYLCENCGKSFIINEFHSLTPKSIRTINKQNLSKHIKKLIQEGMSTRLIAEEMNLKKSYIHNIIKKEQLQNKLKTSSVSRTYKIYITHEEFGKILRKRKFNDEETLVKRMHKLGCSRQLIYNYINKYYEIDYKKSHYINREEKKSFALKYSKLGYRRIDNILKEEKQKKRTNIIYKYMKDKVSFKIWVNSKDIIEKLITMRRNLDLKKNRYVKLFDETEKAKYRAQLKILQKYIDKKSFTNTDITKLLKFEKIYLSKENLELFYKKFGINNKTVNMFCNEYFELIMKTDFKINVFSIFFPKAETIKFTRLKRQLNDKSKNKTTFSIGKD